MKLTVQTYIYNSFFGLCHIRDYSIGDDQKDIILGTVRNLTGGTKGAREKKLRTTKND